MGSSLLVSGPLFAMQTKLFSKTKKEKHYARIKVDGCTKIQKIKKQSENSIIHLQMVCMGLLGENGWGKTTLIWDWFVVFCSHNGEAFYYDNIEINSKGYIS